ncbi:assimilatory sulfite reductase (NADPH) flavoprotein subunit [Virgibacillus sp. NKC19-16]|uniref:assimilatory sulfite reductase (NADPH) flavoprotein subunit n=1 Tax=Virgibacillus salidurans TaxID=2831673 RepID=UPI001F2C0216|nr:assimilatory sulfite reductase (NADPH) flavoprotein subunit [Virgibacillus sp. NKC19-16]UJL47711.1 assimilatory sulfite reductase (NADPH) flavoprotein subunit [Virgibacillus sp. NKC19-16]
MQLQVMNSPFNQEQIDNLNRLLPTLTEAQKNWLSGYLAAPQTAGSPDSVVQNTPELETSSQNVQQIASREVTVLFGSETSNGQTLAEEMLEKLEKRDIKVTLAALDDFKPKNLKKVQDLLIITATHGEGEPPDNAISFYEFLHGRKAPKLDDLRFSVLSLGDQSYEYFCQTGKDFDKRLEELGGERIYPRVDCDVDFDEPAAEWAEGVLDKLQVTQEVKPGSETARTGQVDTGSLKAEKSNFSRANPFNAEILENLDLNGSGSNKETRHLELSIEGSNLAFEPGDSLGIIPENDPVLVDKLIDEMNWDPEETVPVNKKGDTRALRDALLTNFEITRLIKPLVEQAAQLFRNDGLSELVRTGREEELKAYLVGRDLLDLIKDFPPREVPPSEFVQILRKIPARLYSITSSYKANPEEVHLTIGTVRYNAHGRNRLGVCSGQSAERAELGSLLPIYIQRNPNFKFPADANTPVIMIGPGTGVAPFRSFLEEREETGVDGKTWLFYGDQHFSTDFLYQVEWQKWLKEGVLSRMDVAFSRDLAEKVYVQHLMLEKSEELYQWLKEGANVYVCGDEKRMAKDVNHTLITILEQEGGMSYEEAEVYLKDMRQQKRYQRDIY